MVNNYLTYMHILKKCSNLTHPPFQWLKFCHWSTTYTLYRGPHICRFRPPLGGGIEIREMRHFRVRAWTNPAWTRQIFKVKQQIVYQNAHITSHRKRDTVAYIVGNQIWSFSKSGKRKYLGPGGTSPPPGLRPTIGQLPTTLTSATPPNPTSSPAVSGGDCRFGCGALQG